MERQDVDCPSWCIKERDHDLATRTVTGDHTRFHISETTVIDDDASVGLCRTNTVSSAEVLIQAGAVMVEVHVPSDQLNGPQARWLGAALLKAADNWDNDEVQR